MTDLPTRCELCAQLDAAYDNAHAVRDPFGMKRYTTHRFTGDYPFVEAKMSPPDCVPVLTLICGRGHRTGVLAASPQTLWRMVEAWAK